MGGSHVQMMVNSLWSFTSLRWYPVRSLQRLLDALHKCVSRMKSVELCNTLWVCARLGHHPGNAMLTAIDRRIQQLVGAFCLMLQFLLLPQVNVVYGSCIPTKALRLAC